MTDSVVLVTGASRGVGRRIAESFLADGSTVIGVARSALELWEGPESDRFHRHVCDLTDESAVKRLFSEVRKGHGRLDVVVNNAGAFSGDLLFTASADRFGSIMRANLISAHLVTREAVKIMRPRATGRVVSISSIAARIPLPGNALYASTKIALEALMTSFAVEFRGSGVTFNSVGLSFLEDTGMVDALRPDARAAYEARLLVPAGITIDEVMHAVRSFTAPEARSVTGQTLMLGSPF